LADNKKFLVKNGLTTQNISFVDNITSTNNTIIASMSNSDTLSFSGESGQLFSITDSMSGTIFAVNDISGVPSIEVDDDGAIRLAETFGNVSIGSNTDLGYKLHISGNTIITGDMYVANAISSVDSIQFDLAAGIEDIARGQLAWSEDDATVSLGLGNATLQLGQEEFLLVKNQSGETIGNGNTVMFAGTLGSSGRILGQKGLANGSVPSKYFIGISTSDIADGEDGYVTTFGKIRGIDTSMFAEGDILFAHPSIPGALSNSVPIAPNNKIVLAAVISSDANNGTLFTRLSFADKIVDLEDVYAPSLSNNNVLAWSSANARFEATILNTLATASGNTIIQVLDSGNVTVGINSTDTLLQVNGAISANNITITGALSANGTIGTSGQTLRSDGVKSFWSTDISSIGYTIDGGGATITTGTLLTGVRVPYNATINSVTLFADRVGSIVIDIWKDTFPNFPPTVDDSITGSAKPTLTSERTYEDTTLTGWTTTITAGDIIFFNVDSVTDIQSISIFIEVTKT
jgi:hypothetical protein